MRLNFRRRNMTVLRNSLTRYTARHLRIKRLVRFILVDPVYHNALTNCAALLCRALRRVARMCSRTVSDTANMSRHGSTLCSPTVEKILCRSLFRSGHMSAICARPFQKEVGVKRVETVGVYPLAPPRGAARSRRPQTAHFLAESQRKTSRPERGEHAYAVRVPRSAGAEKDCRPDRT